MAVKQAPAVHQDVSYDVEVDTTGTDAQECARVIISSLRLT